MSGRSGDAVISTCSSGLRLSATRTVRPAARTISPLGAVITPWLSTAAPISTTLPPLPAAIRPWFTTAAARAVSPLKLRRPARKSSFDSRSEDATRPATSICAPAPNSMPLGLTTNTRPFDCKVPSISEGSMPTTRFNTALADDCWMKRVVSLLPIENCCQLMIAPGVLVTASSLPWLANVAWPFTTTGPTGLPYAGAPANHAAIASAAQLALRSATPEFIEGAVTFCYARHHAVRPRNSPAVPEIFPPYRHIRECLPL